MEKTKTTKCLSSLKPKRTEEFNWLTESINCSVKCTVVKVELREALIYEQNLVVKHVDKGTLNYRGFPLFCDYVRIWYPSIISYRCEFKSRCSSSVSAWLWAVSSSWITEARFGGKKASRTESRMTCAQYTLVIFTKPHVSNFKNTKNKRLSCLSTMSATSAPTRCSAGEWISQASQTTKRNVYMNTWRKKDKSGNMEKQRLP